MVFRKLLFRKGCYLVFQNSHADFPFAALYFCNRAGMVELIDGYEVKLVLSALVPPVADTGILAALHRLGLEPAFKGAACKLFIIVGNKLLEQRCLPCLNHALMWIDEPEPEA